MAAENPYGVIQPPPVPQRVDMPNYSPFAAPGVFDAGRAAEQSARDAIMGRHYQLYSGEQMRKKNEYETALHGGNMAATPYINQSTITDAETGQLKSLANYAAYGGTEANLAPGVSRAPMQKVGEDYYFNGQPLATPGVDNGDLTPGARVTFSTLGGGYNYNVPPPPTMPFDPNGGAAVLPAEAGPDLPAAAPAESVEGRLNPTGVPRPGGVGAPGAPGAAPTAQSPAAKAAANAVAQATRAAAAGDMNDRWLPDMFYSENRNLDSVKDTAKTVMQYDKFIAGLGRAPADTPVGAAERDAIAFANTIDWAKALSPTPEGIVYRDQVLGKLNRAQERVEDMREKYGLPAAPKPAAAAPKPAAANLAPPPGMPAHHIPNYNNVANAYAKWAPGGPGAPETPMVIAAVESGFNGRPNDAGASSADGFAQFTKPTWLGILKKLPVYKGRTDDELWALRKNPGVMAQAERQLRSDNYALATSKYKGQFDPNHPLNLYAMHHFNPDAGAMIAAAFKKNRNQYLPDVMGTHWKAALDANPYLVKKTGLPMTVGELYSNWINRARGFGYFNTKGAA